MDTYDRKVFLAALKKELDYDPTAAELNEYDFGLGKKIKEETVYFVKPLSEEENNLVLKYSAAFV